MVFLEYRPRVTLYTTLFTTVVEATALLFVQRQVKGTIIVDHVTPPLDKMAALYQERIKGKCVQLPTVAVANALRVLKINLRSYEYAFAASRTRCRV